MPGPDDALRELAASLRGERSLLSALVADPGEIESRLGRLAAGRRPADEGGEYALVVEAVREGYLLHYGRPRLLAGAEPDLALLAGDYLYALGLERLAAIGDLAAVRELSDLISLAAQVHEEGRDGGEAGALWLAATTAVATGGTPAHERAKAELRAGAAGAADALWAQARSQAGAAGLGDELELAADAIDFRPDLPS